MSEPQPMPEFDVTGTQPEAQFEVRTLPEGSLLQLTGGRLVQLHDNPRDGVWLICEAVDAAGQPTGDLNPVMCYEIARLLRLGPAGAG